MQYDLKSMKNMTKEKQVNIEMDVRAAAAVRQILFKEQVGYTTNPTCTPERIVEIRQVITNLDAAIEEVVDG